MLFAAGCVLSFSAAWFVTITEQARARAAFEAEADETRAEIQGSLNAYVDVVRAGTALIAANNQINYTEFRAFVSGLPLHERHSGIRGIGFSPRVARREWRDFVRAIRLDGVSRFSLWPPGPRAEYQPIVFFEPSASAAVIGFDLSTNVAAQSAMARARDTGQPVASGSLGHGRPFEDSRPDLIVVAPVYRRTAPLRSLAQRRRALIGFVFATVRLHDLLPRIVANRPSVAFDVYDRSANDHESLMFWSTQETGPTDFSAIRSIEMAGRPWSVALKSSAERSNAWSPRVWETLQFGMLLSFVLFLITLAQVRAWETVTRHEARLRDSEQRLRESEVALQTTLERERDARLQIEAADHAKDAFLATLSHELRTPLNIVLGWLTMLRAGSVREDQRSHALQVIESNARRQLQLIEDLLDVSRIVTGKLRLSVGPLAVAPIVTAVIESLRPTAAAKGIRVDTPVFVEMATIEGDGSRVEQIVWNLLSNAIKFTPPGGRVSVELSPGDRHVEVRVRDTGVGITAEFLPHVFDRFRQADSSTTRAHDGAGLGLAIVRELVQLHGGSIDAHSDGPGCGALFVVRFPAASATTAASATNTEVLRPTTLEGVRVLVVDDDEETRELLDQALSKTGASVATVGSARQAFEHLRTKSADVLICDIGMPDEDGFSLMRRIRSLPDRARQIPAIALTAYAHPDDRTRAMEAGFQLHIAKPVELAELQASLVALTGTGRAVRPVEF